MQPPLVSIIIVQYSNSLDTIGCLESVKKLIYPNYYVIVADNASGVKDFNTTRLFIEFLRDERFKIIHSDKNLGYAGGNNLGIKIALENGADYFFILNPDTIIEGDALTKLVEAAEINPQIGIVGPAVNENGRMIYGGKIAWLKSKLVHSSLQPTAYNLQLSYYIPGAAMLIKKKVIEKIGLLDKRFFLYFEDADYCLRAQKAGYQLAVVSGSLIHHRSSSSTSVLGSVLLLRYHYRNSHLFNFKNGPWYIKLTLPFWSFFIIIKQLTKIAIGRNTQISKAILLGVMDFYKGHFGQINELGIKN